MTEQTIIAYPNLIAQLGGAVSVRHGLRSAWVTLFDGRVIRLPLAEVRLYLDDGIKVADVARAYAYRHE